MHRSSLLFLLLILCSLSCRSTLHHQWRDPMEQPVALLSAGDTLAAMESLQGLARTDSPPPTAFVLLGSLLRSQGTIRKRLESQLVLETGVRRYPDDTAIRFELGKTYYEQQFYPDAASCFHRVLEQDSSNCDAMHRLGRDYFRKWKRNQGYRDELDRADSFFTRAYACNPHDSLNAFYYAFAALARADTANCRAICMAGIRTWPGNPRFRLLLGVREYLGGRYRRASEAFDLAFALMSESERLRYQDISPLLEEEEQRRYETVSAKKKKQMLRTFWIENDPDPTTDVNERYLEHLSRTVLAGLYFSPGDDSGVPEITDRGLALIKFGWPTRIEYGLGGGLTGRFEKWTYIRDDDAFEFTFMDEFLNDRFSIPMDAGYKKQELIDKPIVTTYVRAARSLPGRMNIYTFSNVQRMLENYIYLGIDYAGSREILEHSQSSAHNVRFTAFDDDWKKLDHIERTIQLQQTRLAPDSSLYIAERLDLPCGDYRFAATFEDSLSLFQSVFRAEVSGVRFLTEALTMSDLVLFKQSTPRPAIPILERNGHSIMPCVYHRYYPGEKVGVYLEIYNLKRLNLRSNYEISYFIFEAPPGGTSSLAKIRSVLRGVLGRTDPPAISQTISYSGSAHSAFESLLIDIGSLEPGRYELQISIVDRIASERAVSSVLFYCTARK